MNRQSRSAALLATGLVAATAATAPAQASGFYLQEQSIRGAGRAFSGEGADTGAASLWWNPAAIVNARGTDIVIGVSEILPRGQVANNGTIIVRPGRAPAPVGGDPVSRSPIEDGTLPSGAVSYSSGRVAFGVAVTSPFSFTTQYPSTSWARYTADRTSLRTVDIQPSMALAIGRALSIGAGVNIEHVSATLSNYLPNLSPLLPDGHQSLTGKGWDLGWTAGAQLHTGPLSVGLSYKSQIKHTLSGSVTTAGLLGPLAAQNSALATQATFETPWQAIGSVRLAATHRLTLEGQVVRYGWSRFNTIALGPPLNAALPENYRNTWSYAGGFDYLLSPALTVRAGVQRDLTPTRDGQRDARVPDSNRWLFAGGASVNLTHHVAVDLAASYTTFADASIDRVTAAYAGTIVQTPILVNGRLENAHALVFGAGGHVSF
jgi:long-chain fatty acid transport protein